MSMPAGHVVGDERRHADAEIHVVAVLQLAGDASGDALSNIHAHSGVPPPGSFAHRSLLNPLFVARSLQDVLHEDARA